MKKILIPLLGDNVAPRFDLAPEILIAVVDEQGLILEERTIVLPQASAEALCHLIFSERVETVVCCGIEEEYFQYLTWKKVTVLDSVMGPCDKVLQRVRTGLIQCGDILVERATGQPAAE
jgi:predicted Fe-Mo cluster-binding NifX family protein